MDYNIFSQFTFGFDVLAKLSLPPCFFGAKFFNLNNIFRMFLSSFTALLCLCLPACLNAKPMLVENPFMTIAIDRWDNLHIYRSFQRDQLLMFSTERENELQPK